LSGSQRGPSAPPSLMSTLAICQIVRLPSTTVPGAIASARVVVERWFSGVDHHDTETRKLSGVSITVGGSATRFR
jgi:hypothetical protein